jgi:pimeloyl-ACP methyl ester carboxylesterase
LFNPFFTTLVPAFADTETPNPNSQRPDFVKDALTPIRYKDPKQNQFYQQPKDIRKIETMKNNQGRYVKTPLGNLWVVEAGQGSETIVLWPAIMTDHHIYDGIVSRLEQRFRFLLIDGTGHGKSDGPTTEFSMADCANALSSILDTYNLDRAIVGGTSWGGLVGAELTLMHPERVKALILMNTPMNNNKERFSLSSWMISISARWMLHSRMFQEGVAKSFFQSDTFTQDKDYADAFYNMLQGAKAKPLATAVRSVLLRGTPLIDKIDQITVPTLIIAGEDDEMYPIETQVKASLRLQNGFFQAVAGKHISSVDVPDDVANSIESFLTQELFQ